MKRVFIAQILLLASLSHPAAAQQTREEAIAAEQAEKARHLKPYEPTRVERLLKRAENALANPPTVYVWLGTVYPGSLFGAGPGLRLRYGGNGIFDAHAGITLNNYKVAATRLRLPVYSRRQPRVELRANWIDAPDVAFYGIGNDTRPEDRTSYLYRPRTLGAAVQVKPVQPVTVGGGIDYLAIETELNGFASAPGPIVPQGLAAPDLDTTYVRIHAFGMVDWRESPGYTRSGGMYRLEGWSYRQRDAGPYSFERVDGEISQFIPIVRGNWVIALNALASVTMTRDGNQVPFFLLPDLGGGSELRGYPSLRFRDRHRLLLTGEYRWTPSQFVDMAVFYSAGKVAAETEDLNLQDMKSSYGGGVRFHTTTATVLRVELAHSREGYTMVFAFSPIF